MINPLDAPVRPIMLVSEEKIATLRVISADSILGTEWPEPRWAIPGKLPVGLTVLGGRPKSGKSWLATQTAQAVGSGGIVFGERVEPGPVLYIALEDTPRRLKERMLKQNWPRGLPVDFMHLGDLNQFGDIRKVGSKRIEAMIRQRGYRLTVIDTLGRMLRGIDRRDPNAMSDVIEPLFQAAHSTNSAVLIIDHLRKAGILSGQDIVDDLLDSTVKAAMVDTLWGLYRERGKQGAKLQITGKEIDECTLVLEFDRQTACWQLKGDGQQVMSQTQTDLIEAVKQLGGKAKAAAVASKIGKDLSNTRKSLIELVNDGLLALDDHSKDYSLLPSKPFPTFLSDEPSIKLR